MIILRQSSFSIKDIAKSIFRGAIKELNKDLGDEEYGKSVYGIIKIDRFVDKSRFLNKSCVFRIDPETFEVEGNTGGSSIFWDLSEEFEPTDNCPKTWKTFTASGMCKDGETLDAKIICKDGKVLSGRVMVELEKF